MDPDGLHPRGSDLVAHRRKARGDMGAEESSTPHHGRIRHGYRGGGNVMGHAVARSIPQLPGSGHGGDTSFHGHGEGRPPDPLGAGRAGHHQRHDGRRSSSRSCRRGPSDRGRRVEGRVLGVAPDCPDCRRCRATLSTGCAGEGARDAEHRRLGLSGAQPADAPSRPVRGGGRGAGAQSAPSAFPSVRLRPSPRSTSGRRDTAARSSSWTC